MRVLRAAAMVLGLVSAGPASSCDLALALAVDVSGSVDTREFRLQMDGLAAALRDPIISEALVQAEARLMLVQWTGSTRQAVAVPWTAMTGFGAVEAFADRVVDEPRIWRSFSTAIGDALRFTLAAFPDKRICGRRLIDLSGDGISNEGTPPLDGHADLRAAGITVNALAIEASEPNLTEYFFENVLVGDGAFVVTARDFTDYPQQIRKKLLREVTKQTSFLSPVDNSALQREPLSRK